MRKDTVWEKKMSETQNRICAGNEDLVVYLYGEGDEKERLGFQNHLADCATCSADLSAFGGVHDRLVAWRDEALNPGVVNASRTVNTLDTMRSAPNRSALNALREFFTLSPIWLRGATAFASLLFVTLLIVTAMRLFQPPETQVAKQTPSNAASTNGIPTRDENRNNKPEPVSSSSDNNDTLPAPVRRPNIKSASRVVAQSKLNRRSSQPVLSNDELTTLLVAENDDEETVPRLYDLLYESN